MKKIIIILVLLGIAYYTYHFVFTFPKMNRYQVRVKISRNIACYLKDNNYRFPCDWSYIVKIKGCTEIGGIDNLESYTNDFTLPWGVSVTNTEVMAGAWFKTIKKNRHNEDIIHSRLALFHMDQICSNEVTRISIMKALKQSE
jgi:hypothetical protein